MSEPESSQPVLAISSLSGSATTASPGRAANADSPPPALAAALRPSLRLTVSAPSAGGLTRKIASTGSSNSQGLREGRWPCASPPGWACA